MLVLATVMGRQCWQGDLCHDHHTRVAQVAMHSSLEVIHRVGHAYRRLIITKYYCKVLQTRSHTRDDHNYDDSPQYHEHRVV